LPFLPLLLLQLIFFFWKMYSIKLRTIIVWSGKCF
jgi:hypothetical protein